MPSNWITSCPDPAGWAKRIAGRSRPIEGCIVWTGTLDKYGYGKFIAEGRYTGAHRAAWLALRGPIPEGLVIDHLCRNRACVNPEHMEPVTNAVNVRRGGAGFGTGQHHGLTGRLKTVLARAPLQ